MISRVIMNASDMHTRHRDVIHLINPNVPFRSFRPVFQRIGRASITRASLNTSEWECQCFVLSLVQT